MPTVEVYLHRDKEEEDNKVVVEGVDSVEFKENGQLFLYKGDESSNKLIAAFANHNFTHFIRK